MIEWAPCEAAPSAECATVALTGWEVAVARIRAPVQPARGQLWFVTGGPGDSGVADLVKLGEVHRVLPADLDLLTFDPRGTGGSGRLSCPDQEAPDSFDGFEIVGEEWGPCVRHVAQAYGEVLPRITTTHAAQDLVALSTLVSGDGDEVWWWGLSYGTFLVERALVLAPALPAGVLLDGIVPPDWSFLEFDASVDEASRRLLEDCGRDPVCREHLGADPVATAEGVLRALGGGHCARLGVDAPMARLLAGVLLQRGDRYATLVAPMWHRLQRCAGRDVRAFVHLFRTLFPEDGSGIGEKPGHSPVLQRHVTYADLWGEPPAEAALRAVVEGSVGTTEVTLRFAELDQEWPVVPPPDPLDGRWPETAAPILAMHGGLDPTMPVERLDAFGRWLAGPDQRLIVIPEAHHVTFNAGDCPRALQRAFLSRQPLDAGCLAAMPGVDWDGEPSFDERVWGTADRWGDRRRRP